MPVSNHEIAATAAPKGAVRWPARLGSLLRGLLAAGLLSGLGTVALQCDNGAVGEEACRTLESRRCELAVGCKQFAIETEEDVSACKMFYRDQCEFGVADGKEPDDVELDACMKALDKAEACKSATTLADCDGPAVASNVDPAATSACFLIECPEYLADCGFLRPNNDSLGLNERCANPPSSSSGTGGSGGSNTGGSGGSGGSGGTGGSGGSSTGGSSAGGSGGSGGTGGSGGSGGG